MRIELLYFAWVRERIGRGGETRAFPRQALRVREIIDLLRAESDGYAAAFAEPERLRFALDQEFVGADALVGDGAELAIFPPVTGG